MGTRLSRRPRAAAPERKEKRKGKHRATRPETLRRQWHQDLARRTPHQDEFREERASSSATNRAEAVAELDGKATTLLSAEEWEDEMEQADGAAGWRLDAAIVEEDDPQPHSGRRHTDPERRHMRWTLASPAWEERPSRDHLLVLDGPEKEVEAVALQVQATNSWFPHWLVQNRPGWIPATFRSGVETLLAQLPALEREKKRSGRLARAPRIIRATQAAVWLVLLTEGRGVLAYSGPSLDSVERGPDGKRKNRPLGLLAKAIRERRPFPPLAGRTLVAEVAAFLRAPHRAVAEAVQAHSEFHRGAAPLLADAAFRERLLY